MIHLWLSFLVLRECTQHLSVFSNQKLVNRKGPNGHAFDEYSPVAIAKRSHPFPSRTRPLSSSAPMVIGGFPL